MFTSLVHLFIVTVTLSVWPIKNCCCPDDTSIATMIAWHGYTMQEPFFVHKALNKKEIPASHTIFFLHIFSNLIAWNYSGFSSFRRKETSSIVTPSGGGGGGLVHGKSSTSILSSFPSPFNSQDLMVNSPLWLLHISLSISYEHLVLDPDSSLYL